MLARTSTRKIPIRSFATPILPVPLYCEVVLTQFGVILTKTENPKPNRIRNGSRVPKPNSIASLVTCRYVTSTTSVLLRH